MGIVTTLKRFIVDKLAEPDDSKSFEKLFAMDQEWKMFGDRVKSPYKQVANIYKPIKAIADNVPQAELIFKDYATEKEVYPPELIRLFENPNPLMSGKDFIQSVVGFHALYGECFIVKQNRDGSPQSVGQATGSQLPDELWTFSPAHFKEVTEGDALIGWRYKQQTFRTDEIIHLRDFNPDNDIRGVKPTDPIAKIIDIDWLSLVYSKSFFTNDATPGGVLSTEQQLSDVQRERIREGWNKMHKGASKAFKLAVLESGLKFQQAGLSHKDMEYLEQKRFCREEMLGIWRVPKALFNITDDLNYATFVGQMKVFWLYGIMPILTKVEAAFNNKIIVPHNKNIYCKFDTSNVHAFQEDFNLKVDTAQKLINMGFTANEVNEKLELGFDPKPWRDVHWIPFSMVPADASLAMEMHTPVALPEEEPKEEPAKQISHIKARKINPDIAWKRFLMNHTAIESKFATALRTYFYKQRARALAQVSEKSVNKKEINFSLNWESENEELAKLTKQYLQTGIDSGLDIAKAYFDDRINQGVNPELLKHRVDSYLYKRGKEITKINDTVKRQISDQLQSGVQLGETVEEMSQRIRRVYNMATSRSRMIARTETTGSVNGGSTLYYDAVGVEKKEWLSAQDGNERPSHQAVNGEVVRTNQVFSNGLDFPGGDGPAEEVINCRCTVTPVID